MLFRTTTTEDDGHSHRAIVNEYGDGETSENRDDGHQHAIVTYQVQPAPTDGHTHGLHIDLQPDV